MLNISERRAGEVTILALEGDIIFGDGSTELRATIRRLLGRGEKKIVLDLEAVGYLDSSGVGELVSAFTAITREGGELKLVNLPPRPRELLAVCKLLSVFDVCQDKTDDNADGKAEALGSLV